ncbi:hypothetical protein ACIGW3_24715 [Streptomyces sp. NPDC053499]|uniref:hypothetical protein n=1 Tax=Streptomyces sp. NPDC053499 TaxID=3365707 RepID=UPI0037D4B985
MRSKHGRWALPLLAALPALLLAGCSTGRDYAVPGKICGVKMPKDAIEPLLPDGEDLRQDRERRPFRDRHFVRCEVSVDGASALYVKVSEDRELPALRRGKDNPEYSADVTEIDDLPFSGWATVSDDRVSAATDCGGKADALVFSMPFQTETPEDLKERRKAGARFIKAFVPGEKKKEGCTAR